MPYAGKTIMPREIAHVCYDLTPWRSYELTKAVGTALGESAGSLGAWHDNLTMLSDCSVNQEVCNPETYQHMIVLNPTQGKVKLLPDGELETHLPESEVVTSRDCGVYEINIPARQIGTDAEYRLRTESFDETEWRPVLEASVEAALNLYDNPWIRNGVQDIRRWQPWVAYTSGWVLFPEFWVWAQDANGVPIGEWHPTGRYIHKAIAGQMNFHIVINKSWTVTTALYYGKKYCKHFNVDPDALFLDDKTGILKWHVPPMPSEPPTDGIGPRPTKNDGV